MPTNPEDRGENQNNIGQQHADQVVNPLAKYEKDGTVDTARYTQDDHAEYTRQREAEAAQGSPSGGWKNLTEGAANPAPTGAFGKAKAIFVGMSGRKKGAFGGLIILLLGLLGIGGTLFTPGIGLVQMKEVLTGNLNDQLAAMDIRGDAVFRAKLKSMSSGVCTGVQIKCKFSTMSKRQVARFQSSFEKYGYSIPADGIQDTALGRQRITKIVAPDGSVIANPADLIQARKNSPEVRSAMKRVFNPMYYGLSDKVANTFLADNKTDKQKKITGTDEEEMRKQMAEATSGEGAGSGRGVVLTDAEGEYVVDPDNLDEDGKPVKVRPGDSNYESVKAAAEARAADLTGKSSPGLKATGGLFRAAGAGVSALGVADAACSVYNLARAVSATAKAARSMQLIQYAMVVNSAADSIKAGDATPEEVEFVGDMMTATDMNKTTLDQNTNQQVENPFYGKGAFDSPGYKTAAYNDAPVLTPQSQQYMVGGGLAGSLSSVMADIEGALPGEDTPQALRNTCGVIQSPWVRGVGLVAGVFLAVGSFGVGTAVSIAASAAVGFAIPFLEATLSDIAAGNVIGENISGVDAGDAFFAGTSALLGGIAMKRGMAPLNKSGIKSYLAATEDTRDALIADAKAEASQNQFDVYNQYSFLGSLTNTLFPVVTQAKSSASGALMSVGSLISTGFASLTRSASAAQEYNEARYSMCNDPGYEELGIDADVFCNVRYGLTNQELAMDSDAVVDFMLAGSFISETGTPQGEYEKFLENCVNREDGWGESSAEEQSSEKLGKKCIDGSGETYANISYFRVYTMDSSLSDAMDDEQENTTSQVAGASIDMDNLYKDSTDVACAPNTLDKGESTGYVDGVDFPIRICGLPNTTESGKPDGIALVNSRVSGAAYAMIEQMKKDLGVQTITFNDSFRSPEKQQEAINRCGLYSQGGCAAAQGYSNHQSGVALDFGEGGCAYSAGIKECPASRYWVWLKDNASKFGFKNEIAEWWHWSPTGG